MICFEKPSINPVPDPMRGVYGLAMGVGYIWEYQSNYYYSGRNPAENAYFCSFTLKPPNELFELD
jgi:hypothetical protein